KQEYQRLEQQLEQQRETLMQEFQQSSLQVLESWLVQWPTAAYAAQQNQQLPAVRLLPLVKPVEQLLEKWGVEAIASVGDELPYDPQQHQLMSGTAQPGDRVRVRYTGYRIGDKLLHRAKVSPANIAKGVGSRE
ncbi:MAG: nucleotide exchange factor GrpE, partial [Moorea sp. SIO4A3]|nr:nucleotide exchange factor GrpE [Moorena sp. SIO4A3]